MAGTGGSLLVAGAATANPLVAGAGFGLSMGAAVKEMWDVFSTRDSLDEYIQARDEITMSIAGDAEKYLRKKCGM